MFYNKHIFGTGNIKKILQNFLSYYLFLAQIEAIKFFFLKMCNNQLNVFFPLGNFNLNYLKGGQLLMTIYAQYHRLQQQQDPVLEGNKRHCQLHCFCVSPKILLEQYHLFLVVSVKTVGLPSESLNKTFQSASEFSMPFTELKNKTLVIFQTFFGFFFYGSCI